jgi:hypothetical protein
LTQILFPYNVSNNPVVAFVVALQRTLLLLNLKDRWCLINIEKMRPSATTGGAKAQQKTNEMPSI